MEKKTGHTTSVSVEYVLVTKQDLEEIAQWCHGMTGMGYLEYKTPLGWRRVFFGEYLVRTVDSGFMSYTPEEFKLAIQPDE